MILVTGAAGLIGSSLIKELNKQGRYDIIGVDNLSDGKKIFNLSDLYLADYFEKSTFLGKLNSQEMSYYNFEAIFHLGACSHTTEWDGTYLIKNNFEYSKVLYKYSRQHNVPFIYASSASVYGLGINGFEEILKNEKPINAYAYSKFQFDNFIRSNSSGGAQVVGLRYFNVYGAREAHKGKMASVVRHFNNQLKKQNKIMLFKGTNEISNGEQKRDFIYIDDCVEANLWAAFKNKESGIFNVGTGRCRSFNELAEVLLNYHGLGKEHIEYIDFPENLLGSYQNYTQASLTNIKSAGFKIEYKPIEVGIPHYLDEINKIGY